MIIRRQRFARSGAPVWRRTGVGCGNALMADTSAAQAATNEGVGGVPVLNQLVPYTDFVALCNNAVSSRRSWAIPVAVVGALVAVGSVLLRGRRGSTL